MAELTKRITVQLESGEAQWLPVLREAVTERTRVDLEYYTYSRDALTRRQVDPTLVFASLGHWYVSGYCHLAQDKRLFRLDRIKLLELTDEHFVQDEDGAAELPPPLVYVPGADDIRVRIRVPSSIATWLAEYYPVEGSKTVRGDRTELTLRTATFPWLEKLLLRFGSDVEVVEPAELAERMRDAAKRILKLYEPADKKK